MVGNAGALYQDSTGGWPLLTINTGMSGDVFFFFYFISQEYIVLSVSESKLMA